MNVYHLRTEKFDISLSAKLYPFVNAYRPHEQPLTGAELRASGLERVETDSLMEFIEDQREEYAE